MLITSTPHFNVTLDDGASDFWLSVLSTFIGAVVGAFVAWLFSLDLRRRSRADDDARREAAYVDEVRGLWPQVAFVLSELASARRDIVNNPLSYPDWGAAGADAWEQLEYQKMRDATAVRETFLVIYSTAAATRGSDHALVVALGRLVRSAYEDGSDGLGRLERASVCISELAVAPPEQIEKLREDALDLVSELGKGRDKTDGASS